MILDGNKDKFIRLIDDSKFNGQNKMYLEHFGMTEYPFALTPNTQFYCDLPGHQAALNVLLFSLQTGEGFIKIIGEVGSGKTLLCRQLLKILSDEFVTAYIPNPDLPPNEFRKTLAHELGVSFAHVSSLSDLSQAILERLLALHQQGKQVVLLVDEAQVLPDETLETIRLLTNLETESKKLIQIVLLGQPELNSRLEKHQFRQLNQRITFSHHLRPLTRTSLDDYLQYRLSKAGYTGKNIFNDRACDLIFECSGGIPRIINILSHKSLLTAFGKGKYEVNKKFVKAAAHDSQDIIEKKYRKIQWILNSVTIALLCVLIGMTGYLILVKHLIV